MEGCSNEIGRSLLRGCPVAAFGAYGRFGVVHYDLDFAELAVLRFVRRDVSQHVVFTPVGERFFHTGEQVVTVLKGGSTGGLGDLDKRLPCFERYGVQRAVHFWC